MRRKRKTIRPLTPAQIRKKRWAERRQRARQFGVFLLVLAGAGVGAVLLGLVLAYLIGGAA